MNIRSIVKNCIPVEIRNRIRHLQPSFLGRKSSYSQSGEDIIITYLLDMICGGAGRRYLDIGANHPFHLSNTALLYRNGGRGVLVEPDPSLAQLLRKKRPRDEVIECGVHYSGEKTADFYIMDSPTLNTFSESEMRRYVSIGHKLNRMETVDLLEVNQLLESSGELEFFNLDIEGLDLMILQTINFEKYRPKCICVESISYEAHSEPNKLNDILQFMESKEYFLYADTFINSIFVDVHCWRAHWSQRYP